MCNLKYALQTSTNCPLMNRQNEFFFHIKSELEIIEYHIAQLHIPVSRVHLVAAVLVEDEDEECHADDHRDEDAGVGEGVPGLGAGVV